MTGGRFYTSENGRQLERIYNEIDQLEKTLALCGFTQEYPDLVSVLWRLPPIEKLESETTPVLFEKFLRHDRLAISLFFQGISATGGRIKHLTRVVFSRCVGLGK